MTELEKKHEFKQKLHAKVLEQFSNNPKHFSDILWYNHETFAIFSLMNGDLTQAKQNFYLCGKLDEYRIGNFNERIFDYGLNHICYALLSDSRLLLNRYALLRYNKGINAELSMNDMVAQGASAICCNTVQLFIANDESGVENNLTIMEKVTVKKDPLLILDYRFFKALLEKNAVEVSEVINELCEPSVHYKRNTDPVLNKYISIPALGYAKLACFRGIDIKPKSHLIPQEILPINPLPFYNDEYSF